LNDEIKTDGMDQTV